MAKKFQLITPIVLVIVGLFVLDQCTRGDPSRWPERTFTSSEWMRTSPKDRYVFVQDILRRHLFVGKTYDEMTGLLGSPSQDFRTQPEHLVEYEVQEGGSRLEFASAGYVLDLLFDEKSGRIKRARLRSYF